MDKEAGLKKLIESSQRLSISSFGREINFCHTSDLFPAISLTGSSCALNCKHCQKTLITRLPAALTPSELKKKCLAFHRRGASGVLLTGGCDKDGTVPVKDFLPVVREVKEKTGMIIIAHTGLAGADEAKGVKEAGIDGVCLDVVGCEETTEEIYNLSITPSDYKKTLKAFEKAQIKNISPHVCVGLHYGTFIHEEKALEIISCINPSNVVITGLTGIRGTPMENIRIDPAQYIRVMCLARERFPESFVSAGCARGTGRIREIIDRMAVFAGVNNIGIPTKAAYEEAQLIGRTIKEYHACCCLRPQDLKG